MDLIDDYFLEDDINPEKALRNFKTFLGADNLTLEERVEKKMQSFEVEKLLQALDYRGQKVLRMRFGLDGDEENRTLEDIGAEMHLTRERVRQIEKISLQSLREILSESSHRSL